MTAYDPDNIFGKILKGDIPSHKIYEDDDIFAFMDVMPQSTGHALVIPKTGSRNILDADPQVLANLIQKTQTIARAVMTAMNADGLRIAQFNEAPAGQTVFHLHFHIIPMYDGVPLQPHTGQMADNDQLSVQAEKIRAALA
ncbi:histidine triad (HIT) family protein [Pelagibacterium luteolum]|uniref:Histidine triad (HIT) family protein n=2 Tax=Pelagibacterium luteolum TaxID=440168 RepID=A0A1G7X4C2_9HYPH|nr:histidine triad (HIT) family protein [Pelagibacterium luteolum]